MQDKKDNPMFLLLNETDSVLLAFERFRPKPTRNVLETIYLNA